jgi:hypothetical protein
LLDAMPRSLCLAVALAGCGAPAHTEPAPAAPAQTLPAAVAPAPREAAANAPAASNLIGSITRADDSVLLGTGAGLFRAAPRGGLAERVVGELRTPKGSGPVSSNLVVSSPVAGELLASGHPDSAGSPLPQNLGLIKSTDGGATWEPVSAFGRDDFHIIQAVGDRVVVVGADGSAIRMSTNAGRSFAVRRTPPAPPVDVAFDPGDPDRMAMTSEQGLYTSSNEGRSWRPRDTTASAHLAWSPSGELYRADPGGFVKVSRDGGKTWKHRGSVRRSVTKLAADAHGALYASVPDAKVVRSTDGGATWDPFIIVK